MMKSAVKKLFDSRPEPPSSSNINSNLYCHDFCSISTCAKWLEPNGGRVFCAECALSFCPVHCRGWSGDGRLKAGPLCVKCIALSPQPLGFSRDLSSYFSQARGDCLDTSLGENSRAEALWGVLQALSMLEREGEVKRSVGGWDPFGTVTKAQSAYALSWVDKASVSACGSCEKKLGRLARPPHNCRLCGGVFCAACSKARVPLMTGSGSGNGSGNAGAGDDKSGKSKVVTVRACGECAAAISAHAVRMSAVRAISKAGDSPLLMIHDRWVEARERAWAELGVLRAMRVRFRAGAGTPRSDWYSGPVSGPSELTDAAQGVAREVDKAIGRLMEERELIRLSHGKTPTQTRLLKGMWQGMTDTIHTMKAERRRLTGIVGPDDEVEESGPGGEREDDSATTTTATVDTPANHGTSNHSDDEDEAEEDDDDLGEEEVEKADVESAVAAALAKQEEWKGNAIAAGVTASAAPSDPALDETVVDGSSDGPLRGPPLRVGRRAVDPQSRKREKSQSSGSPSPPPSTSPSVPPPVSSEPPAGQGSLADELAGMMEKVPEQWKGGSSAAPSSTKEEAPLPPVAPAPLKSSRSLASIGSFGSLGSMRSLMTAGSGGLSGSSSAASVAPVNSSMGAVKVLTSSYMVIARVLFELERFRDLVISNAPRVDTELIVSAEELLLGALGGLRSDVAAAVAGVGRPWREHLDAMEDYAMNWDKYKPVLLTSANAVEVNGSNGDARVVAVLWQALSVVEKTSGKAGGVAGGGDFVGVGVEQLEQAVEGMRRLDTSFPVS